MKLTRIDLRTFASKLDATLASDAELSFDVVYAITKTKNKIKSIVDEINDVLISTQKLERNLAIKYCTKDQDGKPVIVNDRFAGIEIGQNPEYDEKIEDVTGKKIAYLKEAVEIPIHCIDKDSVPKKGKTFILETLCYFIKDE